MGVALRRYYITFRDGENYGCYAVVYAPNLDEAFQRASVEYGEIHIGNVHTEENWKFKYTEHLRFLREINEDEYDKYCRQRKRKGRYY